MNYFMKVCCNVIKRYYLCIISAAAITSFLISYFLISTCLNENYKYRYAAINALYSTTPKVKEAEELLSNLMDNSEWRNKILQFKMERLSQNLKISRSYVFNNKLTPKLDYNIHIFYYAWYANTKIDGHYRHWNHMYIENWRKEKSKVYPTGSHTPPFDIGSNFYPMLGCYSSRDVKVMNAHMKLLQDAGVGVIILSWLPPKFADSPHDTLHSLFDIAAKYKLKIALHVQQYSNRNPITLQEDLRIFFNIFRNHSALYKMKRPLNKKELPVLYIYDSYLSPAVAWKELLSSKGNLSIRNTDLDAVYIGLLAENEHKYHIKKSHFDGFYTYFSANGFTYGSTWKNWKVLSKFASDNGLIFIPSVGPGYIDIQIRPWNSQNMRHRRHGQYYDVAWRSVIDSRVNYVSINSFNEWHEGTQIEPAQPKREPSFTYLDYEPEGPAFYINLTKWWIEQYEKSLT